MYSIDARDPIKQQRALALLESLPVEQTVMPWQVACEIAAVLRTMSSLGKFSGDYVEAVRSLRACFPVVAPSADVLDVALRLQVSRQLSVWDALLIAACARAGVTRLYTEDLQSERVIEGVELVNPFMS